MFALLLVTVVTVFLLTLFYKRRAKLPPGPFPLPLIGNLIQLGWLSKKHGGFVNALKVLKKEYGPVFTIWLGPQPTVHICSLEMAHEVMVKRGAEFADRWAPEIFLAASDGNGIGEANGAGWVELRRFSLQTLRNFGLGRGLMEEKVITELNLRTQTVDENILSGNDEIDVQSFLDLTIGSIINRMLFSERFEKHHEEEFFKLKRIMDEFTAKFTAIDFLYEYPLAHNIPFLKKRWAAMIGSQLNLREFLRRQVRERMQQIASGSHIIADDPEDYVDAYIVKMKEEENVEGTIFHEEGLLSTLMDLWTAGQDTTTGTLMWGFYHMLQNPETIEIARKELVSITNGERSLSLKDKPNTPYFNALVTEIQRTACLVAINLFRRVNEDTTVLGFPVAKGTAINAEISVLMNEDQYFDHPEKFNPSRFLENDKLEQHVLPFSIGKRSCPGESLAKAEIYLILGNLFLRYKFEAAEDLKKLVVSDGIFRVIPSYRIRLTKL